MRRCACSDEAHCVSTPVADLEPIWQVLANVFLVRYLSGANSPQNAVAKGFGSDNMTGVVQLFTKASS